MERCTLSLMAFGFFLLSTLAIHGIGVDVEELKASRKVDFINYPGESKDLLSIEDVRNIGRDLSRKLNQGSSAIAEYENKYTIIHAFDTEEQGKLGADILVISANVIILHIEFIRQLLIGFLMNQYAYSREDAETIALFITYYNAVHRGDMAYFNEHYQVIVNKNIDSFNAGIALSYEQWPGNTRLLIPLTEASSRQDPAKVDTSIISDKDVIKELQKTDDKGIEERTNLVEIKEKNIAEDKAAIEKEKTQQAEDKQELKKTEMQVEEGKKDVIRQEEELAKEKQDLRTVTNPEEKKTMEEKIIKKEDELTIQKEELAKKEDTIKTKQQEIDNKDKILAAEDQKIAQKEEAIAQDKAGIEKDKKIVEVKKDPEKFINEMENLKNKTVKTEPILKNTLYYLKVKEYLTDGHYNNELYAVDITTNQLIKVANNAKICGHEYFVLPEGILVITYTNSHRGHYLTFLDPATLEPVLVGKDLIFHRSFIQFRGDFIYAVIWDGQRSYYLGKFNKKLDRVAQSAEKIDDNTVFHLSGGQIYVNAPDKKILVLSDKDLSKQGLLDF